MSEGPPVNALPRWTYWLAAGILASSSVLAFLVVR